MTKRGLGIAGFGGCTSVFVGDLSDNHRIFLNIEVIFCIKPLPFPLLAPELDDFLLVDIDTRVDFLSNKALVCSSAVADEASLSSSEEIADELHPVMV